jgi:hypothetical protein
MVDAELISEDELDYRLHKADPVNRAVIGNENFQAAVANMQRNIESGAHGEALSKLAERPVYRRRWVTLGAATAAVAVASLVGVETLTGGSGGAGLPLAVPPAAAAQLNKVAHATAAQATPSPGQWEYLEFKTEHTGTATVAGSTLQYTQTETEQTWKASDDSTARGRMTGDGFSFASQQGQATYLANEAAFDSQVGHGPTGLLEDKMFPNNENSEPAWETQPPTDPQTLLADLWAYGESAASHLPSPNLSGQRPAFLWNTLSSILLNSASTQLRATAYSALSYVPATKVLGTQTDTLGRSGVAIVFTGSPGVQETLIVAPSTGDPLDWQRTLTEAADGLPAGTVADGWVFLQRAIVGSSTALPGGGTQPVGASSQS